MNALETAFRTICDGSWRVTCVIVLFLALRPLLRGKLSARVLFWIWIALASRLLVPFTVPVKWSPFALTRLVQVNSPESKLGLPAREITHSAELIARPTTMTPAPATAIALFPSTSPSLVQWAAVAWAVGVVVLLVVRITARRDFKRRLPCVTKNSSPTQIALPRETAAVIGVRQVSFIVTDLVGTPALHGIFRPQLLFPPGLLEKLSPEEIQLIIAHELGHYHRRDLLALGLLHTASVLHWFNPLVWVAAHAARHDCELACDEHVVRHLGSTEPQVYGATLLKLLGLASHAPKIPLGLGVFESKQQIKQRIQMIIANNPSSPIRTILGGALLILIAGISLTREGLAEETAADSSQMVTTTAPNGWRKNGTDNAAGYVAGIDRTQIHDGQPSAYVKSIQPSIKGFGGMMQMCSAENFIGKRLRLSAWMKTENASEGGAHLWFRVDGRERDEMLQFDNMDNRPVNGTTDWQQYSVVLDIPAKATALAYGFFVSGTGQAWVSGVKIEEVASEVRSTNMTKPKADLPKIPVNLEFH